MLIPILSFKRKSCILLARYNAWSSALFDHQYILSILSVYPKDRQSSSQPNHEKLQKNSSSKQDYRWKHWCQYLELLAVSKIYSSLSEICLHSTESLLIAFDLPLANEIDFFFCQHNLDIWFVVFNIWFTVFLLLIYIAPTLLHLFLRLRRFYLIYFTINIDFHLVLIFIYSSPSFEPHKLSLNLKHLYLVFSLLFF